MTRFTYLDGLRGIAALTVVLHHYANSFLPYTYDRSLSLRLYPWETLFVVTPLQLLLAGNFAVCVFFVLSGFVLSHRIFLKTTPFKLLPESIKRIVRLYIPTAVAVLIAYLLLSTGLTLSRKAALITHSNWLAGLLYFKDSFEHFVRNILYGALFFRDNSYNAVLWTMQLELLFSLVLFSFMRFFRKSRWRFDIYLIAFATAIALRSYFIAFLLGVIFADLHVHREQFFQSEIIRKLQPALWISAVLLGSYSQLYSTVSFVTFFGHWQISGIEAVVIGNCFGAALLVLALIASQRAQNILTHAIPLFLGRISLPLYLLHLPVLTSLSTYIFLALYAYYQLPYLVSFILMLSISGALILILAFYYARYIDEPTIALSRRVGSYLHRWKLLI